MSFKLADSKGRVVLGPQFANKPVIVELIDETEARVIAASVVPERELWLHRTERAKQSVLRGIEQARSGKLSQRGPNLAGDEALASGDE